jgi:hypothetical protein
MTRVEIRKDGKKRKVKVCPILWAIGLLVRGTREVQEEMEAATEKQGKDETIQTSKS